MFHEIKFTCYEEKVYTLSWVNVRLAVYYA
jgi:hypothetical protein